MSRVFDTYWNRKRWEQGLEITDIADYLGIIPQTVSAYFVGKYMPKDTVIQKLCDLFSIDFEDGKQGFADTIKARQQGNIPVLHSVPGSKSSMKKLKQAVRKSAKSSENSSDISNTLCSPISKSTVFTDDAILELIYGKVEYPDFYRIAENLSEGSAGNLLEIMYGKIEFDAYLKLSNAVDQLNVKSDEYKEPVF